MHELLALLALAFLAFGAISALAERSPITAPMVFVALGMALAGLGLPEHLTPGSPLIGGLGGLALLLVLFTDAARIDMSALRREMGLPVRLLGIGLPLTLLSGAALASLALDGFGLWDALLLAAILAPTDAALGQAVVCSPDVPQTIRQSLNVESGLNDGIALPVVLLALSFAVVAPEGGDGTRWAQFALLQIGLAPLVGAAIGWLGGRLLTSATASARITPPFERMSALALAGLAFASSEVVGGNGFIAAFVCGLTLGNTAREVSRCLYEFGEAEGQLLTLLIFVIFGGVIVPHAIQGFVPVHWLYAAASLTVVRGIPVALALLGTGLRPASVAFIGWFGPRGLASILYLLIVLDEPEFGAAKAIESIVVATVLLSTFLHGLTAVPLARRYGAAVAAADEESRRVTEHPVRVPMRSGRAAGGP